MPEAKSADETRARALTYKLQRLSDYSVIPSTERLIDPYLPLGGQIVLAGLPKTFKTFVALHWAEKGKVLYIALESYHGVLRRKEAWRKRHGYSKQDLDSLGCITVPINFAQYGSTDRALADLAAQGFRPDFIVIDTWFKSTAGAKVSDQADMTAALDRLAIFQKTLEAVTEFEDALPLVTVLILAHTDKKGIDLFGSIAQFANCDVLYMLNRQGHALDVTLSCMGARDIEEPADLIITLEKVIIETAKGAEENLAVVSGAAGVGKKSKKQDDLTNMETVLEITLQNSATRTQWLTAMQNFGRGWSEANFDKKLGVLKSQKRLIRQKYPHIHPP
jgi:AAA domain-containing protein